jgi:hypothetical protein
MSDAFEREHRTSRSYALRFAAGSGLLDHPCIVVTSLPNAWLTDDPEDLRVVARHASEAADWLDEQYMEPEYEPELADDETQST